MKDVGEPEWTEENIARRKGDTTFQICGWCKYCAKGEVVYDCHLDGHCELIDSFADFRDVTWDMPCRLLQPGKQDIRKVVQMKEAEIRHYEELMIDLESDITILDNIEMYVSDIPPLPRSRDNGYFNLGDPVYVFWNGEWRHATVVIGYRHHDGFVSLDIDGCPPPETGGVWGAPVRIPIVMNTSEFHFFRNNIERYIAWLGLVTWESDAWPAKELMIEKMKEWRRSDV